MRFSQHMKHSLLAAVTGTMILTSAVTPVDAQETLSGFIPVSTTATTSPTDKTTSLKTSKTNTKESSGESTTSSSSTTKSTTSSSSTTKSTTSESEEPLVESGAIPDGQDFEILTSNDGVIITGIGNVELINGELIIPAQIDGKPVVEIDDKAFQNKGITKLTFENGVSLTRIGNNAFQGNNLSGDLQLDVKTIGDNAFAQNGIESLHLKGTEQVGKDAFRDNKIKSLELSPNGDNYVNIGDRAFINNRFSGEIDLSLTKEIGYEAFSTNKIRTVQVGDDTVLRDKVFANNGAWIEVKTSSGSDDTRGIETKSYDGKTGQVIDPVSIIVRYLDQDGNSIAPEQRIGDDLANDTQAFEKGKEATFTPRKIQNYRLDTPEIVFTPDSDGYVVEAKYTYVDQRPTITINRDGIELANGETPSREKLMQGVTAKDKDGNDITSDVKIDTSNVNVDAPGVYDVIYTVVDKNGNERIEKSSVTVGINWGEYEFGGGWQVKDFTYSSNGGVNGFSASGEAKRKAGNTELWIPPVNMNGEEVKWIGGRAFYGKGLTAVKDWGQVTSIGTYAFENNYLSSIPDDWGQITSIDNFVFRNNQLSSLPDDWGQITSIGDQAFYNNQLSSLPDDWGDITSIGDSAFRNNKIESISSWGNVTSISRDAFADNKLKRLPDSWENVNRIEWSAFGRNQLTTLPEDWGKVTSIGDHVFRENQITTLPDDWGDITSIGDSAFYNNQISTLPEDWGKVTSIDDYAFYNNQIDKLPDDWGNITSIGSNAFGWNQLPRNIVFTMKPENLTQEFIKSINYSSIPTPFTIITTDRSNPNNVKSPSKSILINPVRVTYRYIDENGKEIANSREDIQSSGEQVSYEAPTLIALGYQPVEKSITYIVGRNDTQIVNVVYKKVKINEDTNTNISLRLNNKDPYEIGKDMTGTIQIDRTGFDTEPLVNTRVYLTVDPNVYDLNSFSITTSSLNIDTKTFKREGNTFSFVVPLLDPSQSTTIPFRVKFRENFTPSKTVHPITATLVSEQGEVIRISNKESFQGYYNQPYQRIYANGQKQYGLIDDYEQTIISNDGANPVSFVADDREDEKVKNTITYQITNTDIHRNVGDYETRVMIPTYEVHENSKIYDADNPRKLATFDPARNPGWVLSEDGTYVTYKGNNRSTATSFTDHLTFGYPGAKENQRISVRSETTLIPDNRPDTEPVMFTSDNITNHFARYTPPPGKIIAKFPTGNHGGTSNNYFYDNTLERNGNFPWIIPFNATQTFTNAMFRDFDLDERMYYDTVTVPQNLGDVEVRVVDARGVTLQSQKITGTQSRTVTFDKNRVIKGTELQIELLNHDLVKGTQGNIELTSRLKNPDVVIYDDPNQSTIFGNRAVLSTAQGEFEPVYAQKTIKKNIQEIAAFKTQQGYDAEGNKVDQLITDDLIRYTVGFTPREGMGETITNIEEVDLLPLNIDVNDVTLSAEFSRLPGAKYRVVENYNNSGQTAVVFTADSATPDQLNPGSRFNVGNITVRTNMSIPDGRIDNDVFVRANNTGLANKVIDPRLGNDEWSYANVWSNYTAASDMSARKQIRTYNENDEALNWTSSVITEPGAKIDYKLRLDNGTENERGQLVIYDVFPHIGDVGISNPRESKFSNTYDPTRDPVIPEGYTIQYYNGDTFPSYPAGVEAQKESNRVLSALQWDNTPTANTKAVRIVQNEGVKIGSRERVEFILPMRANAERLDQYGNPPADLIGVSAYNTFFWKDDHQPVLIEGNRVENQLKKKPISVQLRKVAQSSNQPLSGARFELRNVEGDVISAATSDEQGYVRFDNVEIKTQYTVREVLAPKGYQLSSQVITLTNDMIAQGYAKNPAVVDLGNYVNIPTPPAPKYGEVEFTKVDVDGNPLPGTKFQLRGGYRISYATYEATANKDGRVIFAGVIPDTSYTLSEIQSVSKLQPINNITNIKVEGYKTTYLGITVNGIDHAVVNDKVKILITKLGVNDDRIYNQNGTPKPFGTYQGTDGSKLSGATFQVIDDATGNVVSTVNSSSSSDTYIENLTPGKVYRLNETKVPNNYEKVDGLDLRFKVDARGAILHPDGTPMEIQNGIYVPNRNKTQESTVTVLKVDQDKNPVANAVFALQRKENDKWIQVGDTKTSGEDGVVSWNTNDSARYRIVETQTPAGYIGKYTSPEFITQRTQSKTFSYTAVNNRIRPEVAKVEFIAQNLPTREAAMEIRDQNKNSIIEQRNNNWNVVRYLEGAVIEVRENDAQGALIQTITTDSTGKAQITADIDPQKNYVLVETQAPEGYELRTQPLTFNATTRLATDPSAKNGAFTVFVPNYKKNGRIVVSKLNESTGEPITGVQATFEALRVNYVDGQSQDGDIEINGVFYRPTGRIITQKTSTSAGVASFNNLDYGTYIVRETASPNGYVLDATPALFTVDENNASHTFVFNNTPADPKIDITKYINGHDANSDLTAVWLDNNAETMEVKTVVENTGNTKLEKVTITDVIRDTDDQYINEALKTAMFTIRDADGNILAENVANGDITLNPGDTVETTVTVASPEKGEMHRDDATVVGYYGEVKVTDDDPAHAYRIPDVVDFILPATGAIPRFGILFLIVMVMFGLAFGIMRRKNIS